MLEKSAREFLELLASKEPVPGGGSACAYVGALGMALGCMVGNLTVGKKKYVHVEEDIKALLEKGYAIISDLTELVQKDIEAFYPLSRAYGLPGNTDEEKKYKEEKLQTALEGASLVPLDIARLCTRAIDLQAEFCEKGTRIAISDVGVGVAFCEAALKGAKLNVLINTKIMKNLALKEKIESELKQIEDEYIKKAQVIFAKVENMITGGGN
ncbi:sugar ABC transporter substrate-binding protein [Thermanaerosceptrum fracticalcis]|uniref:Sugar ABC transporter substrate-binding protein n=1 Tax=Thermanaerosceptrum fracticalcis TaxID=1712410 RepID=A0A7G6E700_THEFR|nr:cyclodeaminase/cyclohydrolase family protein [Thermanaerosceptrum fracticalcis]QNB47854.1 sugar ABC transporter substrate-binding protein [Thermanaerosceptrum fracticalcis]